ncbi:MAG: J domain-containing protein [archaeon]
MINMTLDDACRILNISGDADIGSIKKAYRKKAIETHPDLTKDNGERFKLVNTAYEFLKNNFSFLKTKKVVDIPVNPDNYWDGLIMRMDPIEKRFRFSADVPDCEWDLRNKYVLLKGVGAISKQWGVILVSYDIDRCPIHYNLIWEYRNHVDNARVDCLGGGWLDIDWSRNLDSGDATIKTYGESGDYGPPASLLLVRTCLDSMVNDYLGYTKEYMTFDIK